MNQGKGCKVLFTFTIADFLPLQQHFSSCRCIDFKYNPQMSQIGLSQLWIGLALSALLVWGYCVLASRDLPELTNIKSSTASLNAWRVPGSGVYGTPFYLSFYISPVVFFPPHNTFSSLPFLCFHFSLFLYYSYLHELRAEPTCHKENIIPAE